MKTIIAATVLALSSLTISANANPVTETGSKRTVLDKQLNRVMTPVKISDETALEGVVYVSFRIDEGGNTEILEMNASDERLANHVSNKLYQLADRMHGHSDAIGQKITYKFTFRQEK